ncbi:MAG: response regulator [Nitrosospira sp.]|nr:response regulator [Nitrosospira sp.]
MVVDDNADAAQILSMLLETVGHEVTVEYSAQGALERARHQAPQMLFLDIGLPDMDGYELARQLRAMPETAQSVFVAVTGYDQLQDQEHSKAAGFDHHLVKPVKVTAILGLLADLQRSRLQ